MASFEEDFAAATESANHRLATEPHIEKAHYNPRLRRVIVSLSNHAWFAFRPEDAQGLEAATTAQLRQIEISPSTFGLHFPALDAHFDITSLMQGNFGSRPWMAQRLAKSTHADAGKPRTPPRKSSTKSA